MSVRVRWLIVAAASLIALGLTGLVGLNAWRAYAERQDAASAVATIEDDGAAIAPGRIVFRNTAAGAGYGHVSSVDDESPDGRRSVTDVVCDRVDATVRLLSCLRTVRGIAPTFTATLYDADRVQVAEWPLPGVPSRTRLSTDGSLVATTSFVTGHSYAAIGFSTETVIRREDGSDLGSLESWTLRIDGEPSAPQDRNFWGVTFADDDDTFYATVGISSTGTTYLVRGSISARTLDTLAENIECPSLSPDGRRIAFKRVTSGTGQSVHWTPAVYDIATGSVAVLPEDRSIDDQIEWLDDRTVLYGVPREESVGDSDVWSLAVDGSSAPAVFIPHAWSPSVIR